MDYGNSTDLQLNVSEAYLIPLWRQIIWCILFISITLIGTTGNMIVVWIVIAHKSMRTVTNLLIVNLAVADALVALLNVTFSSYHMIFSDWPFGWFYCKLNEAVATITICVSVITLSVISIDRYTAIMTPFKGRMSKRKTIAVAVFIWIISFVIITPTWLYISTGSYMMNNRERRYCAPKWPASHLGKTLEQVYSVLYMIVTYFLPLFCMAFTYGRVSHRLWGTKSVGIETQNHLKKEQAKKKIVKMMIVVVIIFAICWLPYHVYFIVTTYELLTEWPTYMTEIYLMGFWLAMSNSMYNPIIYCWMNAKFRNGFKQAFQLCPCVSYKTGYALNETYSSIARQASISETEHI